MSDPNAEPHGRPVAFLSKGGPSYPQPHALLHRKIRYEEAEWRQAPASNCAYHTLAQAGGICSRWYKTTQKDSSGGS